MTSRLFFFSLCVVDSPPPDKFKTFLSLSFEVFSTYTFSVFFLGRVLCCFSSKWSSKFQMCFVVGLIASSRLLLMHSWPISKEKSLKILEMTTMNFLSRKRRKKTCPILQILRYKILPNSQEALVTTLLWRFDSSLYPSVADIPPSFFNSLSSGDRSVRFPRTID